MRTKIYVLIFIVQLFSTFCNGQNYELIFKDKIHFPNDTIFKKQFLQSLNGFLNQKEKPNNENSFILKEDLLETSILLDEMKGIEKNEKLKIDNFYKSYLTAFDSINDTEFLIQLSYIGVQTSGFEGAARFMLIVKKIGNQFYFNSPLKHNTKDWESHTVGLATYHYNSKLHFDTINKYLTRIPEYDKMLNVPEKPLEFYICKNARQVLRLIGVDYKHKYNFTTELKLFGLENGKFLKIENAVDKGEQNLDPHHLWHAVLHSVISHKIINPAVDEASAYFYAGFNKKYDWKRFIKDFKKFAKKNPTADWLDLYNKDYKINLGGNRNFPVQFGINALLVKKIDIEQGFEKVKELLISGDDKLGNENYFKVLENITGITKTNFNENIWKLINAQ